MRIEVHGRNVPVTDELRECVARRFEKVAKQVSPLAVLEVELCEERTSGPETQVAAATLHLKGTTLRARERSHDPRHAIHLVSDELARQVKRHREKRRGRRDTRAAMAVPPAEADGTGTGAAAL